MVETNSKSIASFTLGILSIVVPSIGLILGIIGIFVSRTSIIEIDKSNEKGRSLAISGKVCSIIGICLQILFVLMFLGYYLVEVQVHQ